ncbi:MAG: HAD family phosphatase [Candidatus Parcubacteria bacterium]|nr:HAD family phosphatase [Candidatus Parcubacteria bacterium]
MTNKKFEGIAFDLEGTAIDIEFVHHKAHAMVAAEAGVTIDLDNLEDILTKIPHFIGGPDDAVAEEINNLSNGRIKVGEILRRKRQYYDLWIKDIDDIKPRPGFTEIVQRLANLGIPIAIGSLTATEQALFIMEKSGITKLFPKDRIILREDVKELKPAMDVYLKTAERMGIDPTRQLVFEDSPNGVRAAIRAGSVAVGMPAYSKTPAIASLLEAGARKIFMDWRSVNIEGVMRGEFESSRNTEKL